MELLRAPSTPLGLGAVALLGILPDPAWRTFLRREHLAGAAE
jgi:hypothetical protein